MAKDEPETLSVTSDLFDPTEPADAILAEVMADLREQVEAKGWHHSQVDVTATLTDPTPKRGQRRVRVEAVYHPDWDLRADG